MARFGIERVRQREHKADLTHRGIQHARKRWIIRVSLTAIPMPAWCEARRIRGLAFSEVVVWLRPRDARFLLRCDRECGGTPAWLDVEYRKCKICHRPLINLDAEERRKLDESSVTGRQLPCSAECVDAHRDGRWKKEEATV